MTSDSDDLERLRRDLIERTRVETAEQRARRLHGIGYPTRTVSYLVGIVLWLWVVWLEPKDLTDRPLGSLTLGELGANLGWVALSIVGPIMIIRAFFAEDDGGFEYVNWEGWGKFGIFAILAAGALCASVRVIPRQQK